MDNYIDYREVSEYGRNLTSGLAKLVGLCEFVDVEKLRGIVDAKVDAVEAELQKARNDRTELHGERVGTHAAEEPVRDVVSRFFYFLRSLPKDTDIDTVAFFPGNVMGDLSALKPADLQAKAADVLRGFDTDKNKGKTPLIPWKTDIDTARLTLENAITGKGDATGKSFVATAALSNARKDFLHVYNKVAKHVVRGVLNHLDRSTEMPLFFKDLAVNEGGGGGASPNAPAASPPEASNETG